MRVALGLKAHSGWAALVAIGVDGGAHCVVERRRIALIETGLSETGLVELSLIEDADPDWPGQPYHAAEGKPAAQARAIVERGIAQARRCAAKELRAAAARMHNARHEVVACAVLTPAPMPGWSIAEILAVHFRMHKAEGALYPDALLRAAASIGLHSLPIAEKQLRTLPAGSLALPEAALTARVAALGKSVGAPWGADQKSAALAAMVALAAKGVQ